MKAVDGESKMLRVLSVNEDESHVKKMLQTLSERVGVQVVHAVNAKFGLERVGFQEVDLVIVAEELPDSSGCEFIENLTRVNPFVPCAMLSELDPDDFHEKTEGLGVLMQLPQQPEESDAIKLLEKLAEISKIMNSGTRVAA